MAGPKDGRFLWREKVVVVPVSNIYLFVLAFPLKKKKSKKSTIIEE